MGRGDGADHRRRRSLGGDLTEWRLILWPRPWSTPPLSYFRAKGVSEADTFYDKFTTSVPLGEEVTEGPTKGPSRRNPGEAGGERWRGEVEAAAEQVEEIVNNLETLLFLRQEAVQEDFRKAEEAPKSAEKRLNGEGPSNLRGGILTDNPTDDIQTSEVGNRQSRGRKGDFVTEAERQLLKEQEGERVRIPPSA